MRILSAIAILLSAPSAVSAQMTGAEFEAFVTGNTLTYTDRGVDYGIEEYLPNRRVRWAYFGDQCVEGFWYDTAGQICFVYEHTPDEPQCWRFEKVDGGLKAEFTGENNGREIYQARPSDGPMVCLGPDVGV